MELEVKFAEIDLDIGVEFDESIKIEGGGGDYQEGWHDGWEDGVSQGFNDGYGEGYQDGYAEGENDGLLAGYEDGYGNGFADGKAEAKEPVVEPLEITENGTYTAPDGVDGYSPVTVNVDSFWDAYQENGSRGNYQYAFSGAWWTNDTFTPKCQLKPWQAAFMFYNAAITDLSNLPDGTPRIDFSGVHQNMNCQRTFADSAVEIIGTVDVSNISDSINTLFGWNTTSTCKLHTIQKLIVAETNSFGTNCFQNCSKLENITIQGTIGKNFNMSACPLSTDSVQSVINALKTLTSGTKMTLTLNSTVKGNLSTEQLATITDTKGWTLA